MIAIQIICMFIDVYLTTYDIQQCNIDVIHGVVDEVGLNLNFLLILSVGTFILATSFHYFLIWLIRRPLKERKWAEMPPYMLVLPPIVFVAGSWLRTFSLDIEIAYGLTRWMGTVMDFVTAGWMLGTLLTKLLGLYVVPFFKNWILVWGVMPSPRKSVFIVKRLQIFE